MKCKIRSLEYRGASKEGCDRISTNSSKIHQKSARISTNSFYAVQKSAKKHYSRVAGGSPQPPRRNRARVRRYSETIESRTSDDGVDDGRADYKSSSSSSSSSCFSTSAAEYILPVSLTIFSAAKQLYNSLTFFSLGLQPHCSKDKRLKTKD